MRLLWLFYTAFIVYGSLVPLEFTAMPLEEAFKAFLRIPYLNIGITRRQDWVANLVLYIPMAYLGCWAMASAKASWIWKGFVAVFVLLLSLSIAVGVEFVQVFSPRTVSINDLIAEGIGSGLGVAFFLLLHTRLEALWRQIWGRGCTQPFWPVFSHSVCRATSCRPVFATWSRAHSSAGFTGTRPWPCSARARQSGLSGQVWARFPEPTASSIRTGLQMKPGMPTPGMGTTPMSCWREDGSCILGSASAFPKAIRIPSGLHSKPSMPGRSFQPYCAKKIF